MITLILLPTILVLISILAYSYKNLRDERKFYEEKLKSIEYASLLEQKKFHGSWTYEVTLDGVRYWGPLFESRIHASAGYDASWWSLTKADDVAREAFYLAGDYVELQDGTLVPKQRIQRVTFRKVE